VSVTGPVGWSTDGEQRTTSAISTTFEAIVLGWEGAAVPDLRADTSGLRGRLEALSAAGVHVLVVSDVAVEQSHSQLQARPRGPGTLYLCGKRGKELVAVTGNGTGPVSGRTADPDEDGALDRVARQTGVPPVAAHPGAGEVDALRWVAAWLADRGITGGLTLIVGSAFGSDDGRDGLDSPMLVEGFLRAAVVSVGDAPTGAADGVVHLGGGPEQVIALLDQQLARRAAHRVPQIDRDPTWIVPLPGDPARERMAEALGALGNGRSGTRGSWEEAGPEATPMFLVSGVFAQNHHRLPGPLWTEFDLADAALPPTGQRVLDLRGGTLFRSGDDATGLRSLRFVSVASPQAMALRVEGPESQLLPGDPLRPPADAGAFVSEQLGDRSGAFTGQRDTGIAVAARDREVTTGGHRIVERLAAWAADPADGTRLDEAYERLAEVEALGFDTLLAEHREAWASRWADAEVMIDGDPAAELAARYAVFHLLSAAPDSGEAAVGARGLTGTAYAGHVFWDADVFVLPALVAIRPSAARAMIEYRLRRLPAARAEALAAGLRGARFPWESGRDGTDVTPHQIIGADGAPLIITTGSHEEHIVADVAWAAAHYASWTGDAGFLGGAGRPLLVETARYWASRIQTDTDGSGHIRSVIGPDEYHQSVDDNAYTNVMARWNLRQGAALLTETGDTDEASEWQALAEDLVDGWDARSGLYEQFTGYFDLEPLLMSEVGPPPIAADMLLGTRRVGSTQLIKQADVLMLHHLVPEELTEGSLGPCLDFYEPRTAHGSSLSPAISASLLARAGEPERALALFRLAARLDLDDITGTTVDGLHLATMGGVWQALAFGFLGMASEQGGLAIRPNLPGAWHALALRLRFAGQPIGVRAEPDHVTVTCLEPLLVHVADQGPTWCTPGTTTIALGSSSGTRRQP
jgi:trehalose/maltose hydrolase-like predicted phosphorylase